MSTQTRPFPFNSPAIGTSHDGINATATHKSSVNKNQKNYNTYMSYRSPSAPSVNIPDHPQHCAPSQVPSITNFTKYTNIHIANIPKPPSINNHSHNNSDHTHTINSSDHSITSPSSHIIPILSSSSPSTKLDNSDNDYDNIDDHIYIPQSPSLSYRNLDYAEKYKQFGPRIKLSDDIGVNSNIVYSAVNKAYMSPSNISNRASIRYPYNKITILNTTRINNGYQSDGSDESIISQSYGPRLFDDKYKSRIDNNSRARNIPRLTSFDSDVYIDDKIDTALKQDTKSIHTGMTYPTNITAVSGVSTVIHDFVIQNGNISDFEDLDDIDHIKEDEKDDEKQQIMTIIQENNEKKDKKDKNTKDDVQNVQIIQKKPKQIVGKNVGKNMDKNSVKKQIKRKPAIPQMKKRKSKIISNNQPNNFISKKNIILEDQEHDSNDDMDDDDDDDMDVDGVVVMNDVYDAYRPQRLYTIDPDEQNDDDEDYGNYNNSNSNSSSSSDDEHDNNVYNYKVNVPIPDYQDKSIHSIMNDDIMNDNDDTRLHHPHHPQYQAFNSISTVSNMDDIIDTSTSDGTDDNDNNDNINHITDITAISTINPPQNTNTQNTTSVVQHIKQEPLASYMLQNDKNTSFTKAQRKMILLKQMNESLKQTIQQQSKQIQLIKKDNIRYKNEIQKYKLMFKTKNNSNFNLNNNINNKNNSFTSSFGISALHQQLLSLKEELDQTKHQLLQYEIFDENSELDITTLLSSDSYSSDDDDKTQTDLSFDIIENYIKNDEILYINKLLNHRRISMNDNDDVNCFKLLERSLKYNRIAIFSKILTSYIGQKLGNKLLVYRYDSSSYTSCTLLMIAVSFGYINIANNLLDYFEYNINSNNDNDKIFQYLNLTDKNGKTLLMKAIQSSKIHSIQWVLNQYFNNKIQLKTLIEAKDIYGNNVFNGYIQSQSVENMINEYSPLINL